MNRLIPKIAIMISACLLGMNFMAGAAIAVAPCPPEICCGSAMHHADMLNFALPVQKCCDDCNDLLCGLLNDPLRDVTPVQSSPEIGYSDSSYAVFAQPAGISGGHVLPSKPWQLLAFKVLSNPVPLYIAHLSLII